MNKTIVANAALLQGLFAAPSVAQNTAHPVVGITAAEIQQVLKHQGTEGAGTDRQTKVADLG